MQKSKLRRILFGSLSICFSLVIIFSCPAAQADTKTEIDKINTVLDQECAHLKKETLKSQLLSLFSSDIEKGLTPEFISILRGVVKRTDFDNISEEKTVEIVGLVHKSYKRGAPLEYLDQLFDVAYVKTISAESLTVAANALKELHHSDVPQDIAEEFIYHFLEDGWDPAAMPVLARGLIYGVERGLTPQKIALIIMLDVKNGELKKKNPDQLVLDAVKLVREKEPKNWKPMKQAEKELAANRERMRKVEELRQQAEANKRQQEIDKKKAGETLQRMRAGEADKARMAEQEKATQRIETLLRAYQAQIMQYQSEQRDLDTGISAYKAQIAREKRVEDQKRQENRKGQLADMERNIATSGKSGQLDVVKLYASVDRYLGVPYRYGGDSEVGLDCSAFTRRIYRVQNVELPRSSLDQSFVGLGISEAIMRTGDLVFFDTSITGRVSHVGVYIGNGIFAHASSSKGVTKSSIREKYYMKRFVKANRIFEL